MHFAYFSHNGAIKPAEDASVPLANIEYAYGYGVYETLRVERSAPLFLSQHIDRLMASARIIGLEHPFSRQRVEHAILGLIERLDAPAFNLKVLLIGGREGGDAELFVLPLNPLFPDKKMYRDGVTAITAKYERAWPHAKTLNMLGSYIAYKKARLEGAYDALLVNGRDEIVEGTRSNFFVMKDRIIISPPEKDILLGVTRAAVLAAGKENGFAYEERPLKVENIARYDAAFLTSTSSNIMPLRAIDDMPFNAAYAPLRALMAAFEEFLKKCGGVL